MRVLGFPQYVPIASTLSKSGSMMDAEELGAWSGTGGVEPLPKLPL